MNKTYNTQQAPLVLPEYGRLVQQMVRACQKLPDRDERTRCAAFLVELMSRMFPDRATPANGNKLLWNHLALISDFSLDIDYPVEVLSQDKISEKPHPLPNPKHPIQLRHYGHILSAAIQEAAAVTDEELQKKLTMIIANQMKLHYKTWNDANVEDATIFHELGFLSAGALELNQEEYHLSAAPKTNKQGNKNNPQKPKNRPAVKAKKKQKQP